MSTQVMVQWFEVPSDRFNLGSVKADVQSTYIPYSESNSRHCWEYVCARRPMLSPYTTDSESTDGI